MSFMRTRIIVVTARSAKVILVFAGVYIVTISKSRAQMEQEEQQEQKNTPIEEKK